MSVRIAAIHLVPLSAIAIATAACMPDNDDAANTFPDVYDSPSFYEDVAPILADACGSCHSGGGVGPMTFDAYEDAKHWAPLIQASILARTMPPFNVNNDGSCNTFDDARWLTDQEIEIIDRWVDLGAPEGDPDVGMPESPELPSLSGPSVTTLHSPAAYMPSPEGLAIAQLDDYQCFLIDPELVDDRFIVGFDVEPGNPAIVHHVLGFNVDLDRLGQLPDGGFATNREIIESLESASPDEGWDCFSAAGDGVMIEGVPITWAPGSGATRFPEGTGIRLGSEQVMVLQLHYSLIDDNGLPDQTAVHIDFADEVEREAHMVLIDGFLNTLLAAPAKLEPGREEVSFEWGMQLDEVPTGAPDLDAVDVMGILPHMHQRGRHMEVQFDVEGTTLCGADVDRWDFEWQQAYFLESPLRMTMQDRIDVSCTYDTSADQSPVGPGFGTDDEMCLVGLYLAEAK